ncbi:MAG: chromosome segregation protein SMC, partial [Selenomonas sp.]
NDAVQQAKTARRLYEKMEREARASEEELDDLEQDADDLGKYINERELKRAVLGQEKIRAREQALLKEREEARAKERAEETRREEAALDEELGKGGTKREEIAARVAAWQEKHAEGKAAYDRQYQEKLERHAESQENDKAARAAGQRLSEMQGKLHQMEIAAAEVNVKLEQAQAELLEQYGHTWETAAEEALDLRGAELKKKMQDISRALEELGPVNPNAIREHEELLERHEFMGKQAADLEAARENLMAMIHEMDVTMTRRFKEAFGEIRGYFSDIFVRLFGGGKAELFLTDEKDVLHAGVEIEVQLPAKKRQNLSVLSGGERALTVIALLFSFLRYRPAPFSVLDEIDAPLDEANVARFGKFLGEFAENTQFIVVTHRKGTMEASDFMYGITIEDAGVSRVLSVRLDEAI